MLHAANANVFPVGGRFDRGVTSEIFVGAAVIVGAAAAAGAVVVAAPAEPPLAVLVELLLELPQAASTTLADAAAASSAILFLCTNLSSFEMTSVQFVNPTPVHGPSQLSSNRGNPSNVTELRQATWRDISPDFC
jgi:hypothetical protein